MLRLVLGLITYLYGVTSVQIGHELKTFPFVSRLKLAAFLRFPISWSMVQ